jgi:hypothetical protein
MASVDATPEPHRWLIIGSSGGDTLPTLPQVRREVTQLADALKRAGEQRVDLLQDASTDDIMRA